MSNLTTILRIIFHKLSAHAKRTKQVRQCFIFIYELSVFLRENCGSGMFNTNDVPDIFCLMFAYLFMSRLYIAHIKQMETYTHNYM